MYKQLSHQEAELLMQTKEVAVLDVRDEDSYESGHIAHAVHLSMPALQDYCSRADKSKPVLLYCYHGISSQSVAQHLVEQGFKEVYSLIGGFETWKAYHPTSDANK